METKLTKEKIERYFWHLLDTLWNDGPFVVEGKTRYIGTMRHLDLASPSAAAYDYDYDRLINSFGYDGKNFFGIVYEPETEQMFFEFVLLSTWFP